MGSGKRNPKHPPADIPQKRGQIGYKVCLKGMITHLTAGQGQYFDYIIVTAFNSTVIDAK